MDWLKQALIGITVLLCGLLSVVSRDFALWFHGLSTARLCPLPFTATYDFNSIHDKECLKTVYCDGKEYLAIEDGTGNVIENYRRRDKFLVMPKDRNYYEIDFLQQTPNVCFYQPAFVSHWETIPLGEKKIDGIACYGFQQNGLHDLSPLSYLLSSSGMRLDIVEKPDLEKKRKERAQLWFAKDTGLLVKGDGYTLKSISKTVPDAKHFQIPPGYRKIILP